MAVGGRIGDDDGPLRDKRFVNVQIGLGPHPGRDLIEGPQPMVGDDLQIAGWRIRTDPSITRGGCQVHAASGALDATLETRWARVTAALGRSATAPREVPHA